MMIKTKTACSQQPLIMRMLIMVVIIVCPLGVKHLLEVGIYVVGIDTDKAQIEDHK